MHKGNQPWLALFKCSLLFERVKHLVLKGGNTFLILILYNQGMQVIEQTAIQKMVEQDQFDFNVAFPMTQFKVLYQIAESVTVV